MMDSVSPSLFLCMLTYIKAELCSVARFSCALAHHRSPMTSFPDNATIHTDVATKRGFLFVVVQTELDTQPMHQLQVSLQ